PCGRPGSPPCAWRRSGRARRLRGWRQRATSGRCRTKRWTWPPRPRPPRRPWPRRRCAPWREAPSPAPAGSARPTRQRSRHQLPHRRQLADQPLGDRLLERVDAQLTEVRAAAATNSLERLLEAALLAVEALRGHRVEGVADMDDPRDERDLVTEQAVGIAPAVPAPE